MLIQVTMYNFLKIETRQLHRDIFFTKCIVFFLVNIKNIEHYGLLSYCNRSFHRVKLENESLLAMQNIKQSEKFKRYSLTS